MQRTRLQDERGRKRETWATKQRITKSLYIVIVEYKHVQINRGFKAINARFDMQSITKATTTTSSSPGQPDKN